MASRRQDTAKPSRNRLIEQVRAHKPRGTQMEQLLQKVWAAIERTPANKAKAALRKLEREIVDDLYPRGSLRRTLYDLKIKTTPHKDQEARWIDEQKEKGRSLGQIAKGDLRERDRLRQLYKRFKLRKGQKPN